jgi:ectoine hydroxylase-related dioxygenase (phytanoyl-CoA dioxygenase family)
LDPAEIDSPLERIREDGYTLVEDVFDAERAAAYLGALDHLAAELDVGKGPNAFEGFSTTRVYNLLAYDRIFESIPVHEEILPIVEGVLDRGCLISSLSSIDIGPGEKAQMIHADDQLIPIRKPHRAVVCNTMWALTDFTEANGATRLVPGSHRRDHSPDPTKSYESIAGEMRRGSVLVWNGSLWHGGGANTTDTRRVGIAMNYCAGWIRQQENQQLGIPRDVAMRFSRRLRELVGYGVYQQLIGHVEKRSPEFLLGESGELESVWDRVDRRKER